MKILHPTLVASADSRSSHALQADRVVRADLAVAMRAHESIAIDGAASCGEVIGTGTWAYAPSAVKPSFTKNNAFTTMDHSQRKRLT